MATARCYTKSGSIEKYESNLWSSPSTGNWSSSGIVGTITTPDSYGNYTVTPPNGFEDSNTQTGFHCYTMYGGVRKTFYFKESIKEIFLSAGVGHQEAGLIVVYLAFENNEYLGNDTLTVKVRLKTIYNQAVSIDPITFTIDKNSTPSLVKRLYITINDPCTAETISCSPMGGRNYRVKIRG